MPFVNDLQKIVNEFALPEDLKERLLTAMFTLPSSSGCNMPQLDVPVTADEVAKALASLYQAAPHYYQDPPVGITFSDTGRDFSCSLRQEVGKLFATLMKDFSAHQRSDYMSKHIGPQFVMHLKSRLASRLPIIHNVALTAAKNVWSLVFLTVASLHQDWHAGVSGALPLLELSPRAIPLYLYRKGGLWMVLRLTP